MERAVLAKRYLTPAVVVVCSSLLFLSFQNCTPQSFTSANDQQTLAGNPIFNYGESGVGAPSIPGGSSADGVIPGAPGAPSGPASSGGSPSPGSNSGGGSPGSAGGAGGSGGGEPPMIPGMPTAPNTGQGSGPGTGDGSPMPEIPGAPGAPASPSGQGNIPDGSKIPTETTSSIPANFLCSVMHSEKVGGNLASASSLLVELVSAEGSSKVTSFGKGLVDSSTATSAPPACSFTDSSLPDSILRNKNFPMAVIDSHCPSLGAGLYYLIIKTAAGKPPLDGSPNSIPLVTKRDDGKWSMRDHQTLWLIADYNPKSNNPKYPARPYLKLTEEQCDDSHSPLVIRIVPRGQAPERLTLTAPSQGILFDILGANATPVPYTPVKISWFSNEPQFYFVTLPDAGGKVSGVDQLFGNNTKGPDGNFADNGFLALKKYDANGDGVIDARDPVFSQLRLWNDTNGDGISQSNELFTLAAMGVVSIGLDYDSRYLETDAHGNQIKFKALVKMASGRNQIMFDLWFFTK